MKMNIAFSSDENYARHVAVSMLSLFENNIDVQEICIYLIDNGITNATKQILSSVATNYKRTIIYVKFSDLCNGLTTDNKYPLSSYARLFLAHIENVDKIIYCDCDSIISDSLKSLWEQDITRYYVAGVLDTVSSYYKTSIGLSKNFKYINAGFVLINLKKWREENLEQKFLEFIARYNGSVPHHDQGTLNAICKDHILILPPKYDVMCPMFMLTRKQIKKLFGIAEYYSESELTEAKNNPVFVHFTNGYYNRPWNSNCTHPKRDLYRQYLAKTPWKDNLLNTELPRNTKIMAKSYKILPFGLFSIIFKFADLRKQKKLNAKFSNC